jgi:hypothetical protein
VIVEIENEVVNEIVLKEDGVVGLPLPLFHLHILIEIKEMIETEVIENEVVRVVTEEEGIDFTITLRTLDYLLEIEIGIEIYVPSLQHQIKRFLVEVCLH